MDNKWSDSPSVILFIPTSLQQDLPQSDIQLGSYTTQSPTVNSINRDSIEWTYFGQI